MKKYKVTYVVDDNNTLEFKNSIVMAYSNENSKIKALNILTENFINQCSREIDILSIDDFGNEVFIEYEYTTDKKKDAIHYIAVKSEILD